MKNRIAFLIIILVSAFTGIANAQWGANAKWNHTIPARYLPAAVSAQTLNTISSPITYNFEIVLDAATYDNDTQGTAFNAIGVATKAALAAIAKDTLRLDTANIIPNVIIHKIERGWPDFERNDLKNQYAACADQFVIWGVLQWESN